MDTPHTNKSMLSPHAPKERFRSRRHRREARALAERNLFLISANTGVPVGLAVDNPTLMLVAVEDLCWQLGVRELEARRPRFWRRAECVAWCEERTRLDHKRARLAEMAAEAVNGL
jgi:hypothetical protein